MLAAIVLLAGSAAATSPPHEITVPVPPGEVTLRQVWEGIIATEAEVIIALPEPGLFETPTALRADHPPQVPLDVALDAIAEPLDLVWFSTPSGIALAYARPLAKSGVARRGVGREAVASWCMAWGLLRSLPTDEDRARFLSGEWVQPLSWDSAYGRAVRRAIRQADDAAVRELDTTRPPAVLLVCWADVMWREQEGERSSVYGLLLGHEHEMPPRTDLTPAPSPTEAGPRSFASASWRERTARLRRVRACAPGSWQSNDYETVGPDLAGKMTTGLVTLTRAAPSHPEELLRECLAHGVQLALTDALAQSDVLVALRAQPTEAALASLALTVSADLERTTDGVRGVPGNRSTYDWAIDTVGEVLRELARPCLDAGLAGTGVAAVEADQIWQCLQWRPMDQVPDAERLVFDAARPFIAPGSLEVEPPPPDTAELAARTTFGLWLGRVAEEWSAAGPTHGYVALDLTYVSGSSVGPFEPRVAAPELPLSAGETG